MNNYSSYTTFYKFKTFDTLLCNVNENISWNILSLWYILILIVSIIYSTIRNQQFHMKAKKKKSSLQYSRFSQYLIDLEKTNKFQPFFFFFLYSSPFQPCRQDRNSNRLPIPQVSTGWAIQRAPVVKVQLNGSEKGTRSDWWRSMHEKRTMLPRIRNSTPNFIVELISIRDIFSHKRCSLNVAFFPIQSNSRPRI